MKNLTRFFNSIQFILTMSIILNVGIFVVLAIFVGTYAYMLLCLACVLIFLFFTIVTKNSPSIRLTMLLGMAVLPLVTTVIYMFINSKRGGASTRKLWQEIKFDINEKISQNQDILDNLDKCSSEKQKLSKFVLSTTSFPVYQNSNISYFPKSDEYIKSLIEDLKNANQTILISLFRIANSEIWDEIFSILKDKRLNGIEINLIYDDYGCIKTFKDTQLFEKLNNHGLNTIRFNKIKGLSPFNHYRNKKNIIIIDGKVAYISSLGINDDLLLDSKISKMCAIKATGDVLKSIFAEFYIDWKLSTKKSLSWDKYLAPVESEKNKSKSDNLFVQPFVSTPLSNELINKSIYSCAIANATKSIIISTPYLLLDDEMRTELIRASRSGVEVKILIAGKGERIKKYKFALSRYGFTNLINEKIKLYSYATDNLFNRSIVIDSETTIIGGGAFDSRKTSIHFESGTLIHNQQLAKQVKEDIESTMEVSHLLTIKDMHQRRISEKSMARLLNFFSPLYL